MVGLAVAALTGAGSYGVDRYVAAADRHDVAESLTERMISFRRSVAASDMSQASAQPFVRLVVGAGERLSSPNAQGVEISDDWVDDGAVHAVTTTTGAYLVLSQRITVDGLLATATIGEPATSSPRARSAMRRGLVVLSLFSGSVAAGMTAAAGRRRGLPKPPASGDHRRTADPLLGGAAINDGSDA